MPGPSVQRTIVKSKPEVWSEVSDIASLSRHLGAFGEITITRATPEDAVAWEGDRVRGTVTLERAGWGTKVTVTAEAVDAVAAAEAPADVTEVEVLEEIVEAAPIVATPAAQEPQEAQPKVGLWARLRARWRKPPASSEAFVAPAASNASQLEQEPPPDPAPAPAPAPEPEAAPELREDAEQILNSMLDHIGAAHHRPFSRG